MHQNQEQSIHIGSNQAFLYLYLPSQYILYTIFAIRNYVCKRAPRTTPKWFGPSTPPLPFLHINPLLSSLQIPPPPYVYLLPTNIDYILYIHALLSLHMKYDYFVRVVRAYTCGGTFTRSIFLSALWNLKLELRPRRPLRGPTAILRHLLQIF